MDNTITIVGNLTRDPELRFTPGGMPVAQLGVAVNYRKKGSSGDYEDVPSFFDVSVYGSLAENASESLARGNRVVVAGRLEQRSWETAEGDKRSKVEIIADAVGPDLRWATAEVKKAERKDSNGNGRSTSRQPARATRSRDDDESF
jgi:single-strand DNA-binding protein